MNAGHAIVLVFILLSNFSAVADGKIPQGRFFAGSIAVEPTQVNDEALANGLKKVSSTLLLGFEGTYPVLSWIDLGLRYMKNQVDRDEDPSDPLLGHKVYITQDIVMAIARFPVLKSSILRADVFGGFGGKSATLKIQSSTQHGERKADNLFSTAASAYGASVAIGYRSFFLFGEGGYIDNKVGGLTSSGTINGNIQTLDLSGGYVLVGLALMGDFGPKRK